MAGSALAMGATLDPLALVAGRPSVPVGELCDLA